MSRVLVRWYEFTANINSCRIIPIIANMDIFAIMGISCLSY